MVNTKYGKKKWEIKLKIKIKRHKTSIQRFLFTNNVASQCKYNFGLWLSDIFQHVQFYISGGYLHRTYIRFSFYIRFERTSQEKAHNLYEVLFPSTYKYKKKKNVKGIHFTINREYNHCILYLRCRCLTKCPNLMIWYINL